jgi:serine/threonine-protein kinase
MDRPLGSGLPAPGERIADKYDVVRVVGEGGMGIVYEVMHTRLQQRAAIKMLQPRVQAMPEVAARFEREARAACRLKSRHAVRITDVDHDDDGRAYMVMEFLEGHDLSYELQARGRLPYVEAVDVVLQACVAMAEAHASGVVHRDLKPSNLFLVPEGGEQVVKVLDFGISKLTTDGEAAVTSTFATMGTPLYMSPEQIRSTKNVDGRTDIWSLGVILYEAIAGERPFTGSTTATAAAIVADEPPLLRTRVPDLPEGVEAAVSKALAKKAEDRFSDVRAFAEALAPFASSRDELRAIEAASGGGGAGGSLRPPPKRQSSTPSFVHATTLAQTTPPPVPGSMRSPLAATAPPVPSSPQKSVARSAEPPAPSTEAAWATQRTTSGRAGRATLVAVGVAAAAAAVFVFVKVRGVSGAPPAVPSGAASFRAPPVLPAPPPPVVVASPPLPASASSTPAAVAAPPAETPSPRHAQPKPHPALAHPVSSASAAPTPAPAATNPLHL